MGPGENRQMNPLTDTASDDLVYEKRFLCEILDMTSTKTSKNKFKDIYFQYDTADEVLRRVSEEFAYQKDSFEALYQKDSGEMLILNEMPDVVLRDIFTFSKNNITLVDKADGPPCKIEVIVRKLNVQTKSKWKHDFETHVPPPAPPPYSPTHPQLAYWGLYNSSPAQETGFVGLVNQAMTCYLNSLLQTLYMTPEFRNALYRWEFVGTDEEGVKSVPFQLQKLFLLLQTSNKPAVGTTQLTTSFGWDSSEAWQQHDVQELCRVMFDALEQTFKNTQQCDLFSTLYEGKMKDYVKCLECGYESAREDTFLDVPLVVRPFGSSESYGSVEEALQAFVTPETLHGSNQYFCERCDKKCDAHKGLKFLKFPYLLTLQLKRFDFDPLTMHRIKLNDKVTFPEILNINEFILPEKGADGDSNADCVDACKIDGDLPPGQEASGPDHTEDDEGIDVQGLPPSANYDTLFGETPESVEEIKTLPSGPYVYELFSIMVHSGSANGGHYYAYIKSFKDKEWYCFNDAQVTRITDDDIQKTYGGGPSKAYYSSTYLSSVNAYMLMYRQINKAKNSEFMCTESFPDHIKILLRDMIEQDRKERKQREMDRYMCKIKLFCQHPTQGRMVEMKLKVHKDTTLAEATDTARTIMGLESTVPLDCCRLVKYDDFHDSVESSFEDSEGESMGYLLEGVRPSYKFDLLLEIKQPHETFLTYKPGGVNIKVHVVNLEKEEVCPSPITIRVYLHDTVTDFSNVLAQTFGVDPESLRLVVEKFSNDLTLLNMNSANLKSLQFARNTKVFAEFQDKEDAKLAFEDSKLHSVLDCYFLTICIQVVLPLVDKATLEKLCIQENAVNQEEGTKNGEDDDEEVTYTFRTVTVDQNKQFELTNDKENSAEHHYKQMMVLINKSRKKSRKNKSVFVVTPDDSSQDCDEGLGDSEIGDSCSTAGHQSSHATHSDQSEDSSLTDSERTLVGDELSPRNSSPTLLGNEMDVDIEPPPVFSPDFSRPDSDSAHSSSDSNFQADEQTEDLTNPSSPEEIAKETPKCCKEPTEGFKSQMSNQSVLYQQSMGQVVAKRYFRAWPYSDSETGDKMLRVYVDKRITIGALRKELEPFVGVKSDYFKVFRLYSNNQEIECTRLTENLMSYSDDSKLSIKLGRPLRKGEYKVKLYTLCPNDSEPCRHLTDCVFTKGATVLQTKKEMLSEIQRLCSLEIPLNRFRLRKKNWKSPSTVFLDHQRFDSDIPVNMNWEVFLQILDGDEPVTSECQSIVFLKRWHRSTYTLDKFQEVVLDDSSVDSLLSRISEVSGIPKEQVDFAKGTGTFPCDVSLVNVDNELDWQSLQSYHMEAVGDGNVIYYRDSQEELKKLSEEERRELINKENARCNKMQKTSFSPRKERALKIYTLDSAPRKNSSSSTSSNTATADKVSVPDLD